MRTQAAFLLMIIAPQFVVAAAAWMIKNPTRMPVAQSNHHAVPYLPSFVLSAASSLTDTEDANAATPQQDESSSETATTANNTNNKRIHKLQGKILKNMRQICKDYQMIEPNDHIMICVSGGKDSAVLLYLMIHLQNQLSRTCPFTITAVHVDQKQPGYDGVPLVEWFESEELQNVPYRIIEEDTYSIAVDKTPENKSYCTVCSRLRRGILYTTAQTKLENCTKLMLGHHGDDAMETLLLNMIHAGQMKGMPARYTSKRGALAVMRPLITCMEDDIAEYARLKEFPILPCNLCKNQSNLQRPQVKMLLDTLTALNPNAKLNTMNAMANINPSHLLDQSLREACGMDPITGDDDSVDDEDELEELR